MYLTTPFRGSCLGQTWCCASSRHDFPSGVLGRPEGRRQHFAPKIHTAFNFQGNRAGILFAEQTQRKTTRELFVKKPDLTGLWFAKQTAASPAGENTEGEDDSYSFKGPVTKMKIRSFGQLQHQVHALQSSSKWQDDHSLPLEWAQHFFFLSFASVILGTPGAKPF